MCLPQTTNYQTLEMTCSICQQSGHNRQTCSVVVRYEYDDCGVKCRINPNDEGDFQPVETYCLPCGAKTEECDCGKYKCGKWFNEEKGKFQGAPRRRRQTRFNPIDHPALFTIAPAEIKMKLACADCGQVETECRLEITEQGKTLCCDCLYPENQKISSCPDCWNDYTDAQIESGEVVPCNRCYKCFVGDCGKTNCDCDDTEEEDDDETVSVVSEDTCECCGRPYDHRNPHRQSEMCDCVQNDDGTLSRPEEVPELPCPDCRRWFDEGKDNCKSCDFDLNSFNKPPSPTRDQLIALGKYKLAKFQIGKSEQKDETNWNEDGDDELCSAIDASGNALY